MKAVVQRVTEARVLVAGHLIAHVERGLLVLLGLAAEDGESDRTWMADKLVNLRIFTDEQGKMNRSVLEIGGAILLVPNFTVAGDARKGRRPSFDGAMPPASARAEFPVVAQAIARMGVRVQTGEFGADMQVMLTNDGPVTIVLDSRSAGTHG